MGTTDLFIPQNEFKDIIKSSYTDLKAPFAELPLMLRSVAHFYTTVVNTNCDSRPPNGQCTHVFGTEDILLLPKQDCRVVPI